MEGGFTESGWMGGRPVVAVKLLLTMLRKRKGGSGKWTSFTCKKGHSVPSSKHLGALRDFVRVVQPGQQP